MFTMGMGLTSSYSKKIELNTRSATETELLAANMCMPEMLWTMTSYELKGTRLSARSSTRITSAAKC